MNSWFSNDFESNLIFPKLKSKSLVFLEFACQIWSTTVILDLHMGQLVLVVSIFLFSIPKHVEYDPSNLKQILVILIFKFVVGQGRIHQIQHTEILQRVNNTNNTRDSFDHVVLENFETLQILFQNEGRGIWGLLVGLKWFSLFQLVIIELAFG